MKIVSKCDILIIVSVILIINVSSILVLNTEIFTKMKESSNGNPNILYSTDFEDKDFSKFIKRGSTTEVSISSTAYSGNNSLLISQRKEDWSGVQIDIDSFATPNVEYFISAKVKSEAEEIDLSYKYKDTDGNMKYKSLGTYKGNEWISIDDVKFTFYENMEEVYIYFAGTEGKDIYLDDFSIEIATIEKNISSLKEVYSKLFNIGAGIDNSEFKSSPIKELVLKHFNTIALANELKPDYVLNKEKTIATGVNDNPQIDLTNARPILEFCEENNIAVRGHTITWYDQTPTWFFKENYDENAPWVDKETMKKRLENYIKNLFTALSNEYPNLKISAWDVVNEAWLDNGNARSHCTNKVEEKVNGLMCSPWTTIFEDNSYIEYAFTYARKYASKGTKLYYADFHNYIPAKRQAIYNMALSLKEKNLIDGIAIHGHLEYNFSNEEEYKKYLNEYDQAIELYKKTGLDIQISELDISVSNKDYELQAKFYSDFLDILIKHHKNISYLGFWGITDDNSWKKDYTPNLFFSDYTAKPAFYAITSKNLEIEDEKSSDNNLEYISIDEIALEGFDNNKLIYDIKINNKSKVTINAVPTDNKAVVKGNGIYELDYGITTVKLLVTSEDKTTKEYILNLERVDTRSIIDTLEYLNLSSGTLEYKPHINIYNVEVESNVDKITITSALTDKKSKYIEDYSNKTIDLKYGLNKITIKVQAENEYINTYTINITRKEKNPIFNTKISVKDYEIQFSSDKYEYNLEINNDTDNLDFLIELANDQLTYNIEGNNNLENGSIVKVIVTDINNKSIEYKFNIIKKEQIEEEVTKEENNLDKNEKEQVDELKKETNKNISLIPIASTIAVLGIICVVILLYQYKKIK